MNGFGFSYAFNPSSTKILVPLDDADDLFEVSVSGGFGETHFLSEYDDDYKRIYFTGDDSDGDGALDGTVYDTDDDDRCSGEDDDDDPCTSSNRRRRRRRRRSSF